MALKIGYKSYINEPYHTGDYGACIINTKRRPDIVIGRYSSIGKNAQFVFNHHDYKHTSTYPLFSSGFSKGDIIIGNDVWIGLNVTILDNVTIGDGAVIGANTVVSKNVPPYAIVVGNPGRIVKYRFAPDIIERFLNVKWWNYSETDLMAFGIKTKSPVEFLETLEALKKSS
jgi:virginiamycin A acetyltransferase